LNDIEELSQSLAIYLLRGIGTMRDRDVDALFEVTTSALNQAVKRNAKKFTEEFAFRLNAEETRDLKSQIVISTGRQPERMRTPMVFTEKGVIMVATVLQTDRAIIATQAVVRSFATLSAERKGANAPRPPSDDDLMPRGAMPSDLRRKREGALDRVLDALLTRSEQDAAAREARDILGRSMGALKAKLDRPGIENENLVADLQVKLAQAEKTLAETEGQRLQNRARELVILAREMRFAMAAQHLLESGDFKTFETSLARLIETDRPDAIGGPAN